MSRNDFGSICSGCAGLYLYSTYDWNLFLYICVYISYFSHCQREWYVRRSVISSNCKNYPQRFTSDARTQLFSSVSVSLWCSTGSGVHLGYPTFAIATACTFSFFSGLWHLVILEYESVSQFWGFGAAVIPTNPDEIVIWWLRGRIPMWRLSMLEKQLKIGKYGEIPINTGKGDSKFFVATLLQRFQGPIGCIGRTVYLHTCTMESTIHWVCGRGCFVFLALWWLPSENGCK